MPPRHKTASTASKTVVTDTVDIDTDRQFSGRPLDRELWYQSNKEQLMFECHGAKPYVEYGIVISIKTDKISFQSVPHAQAYNAGTLRKGTLENPFNAADLPASAVEQVKEQPTVGVGETAPAVVNIVPVLMTDLGTRCARFREAPEICVAMDETILRHWVDHIDGEDLANTYLKKYNHSGIAFIIAMETEVNTADPAKNALASARQAELDAHRRRGITDSSTEAWTSFKRQDMRINTSLKGSSKYQDDAQRAFAYAEILQDYSDDIWTRITVEKNRITVKCMVDRTAIVEYDLLDTAVLTVFGQLEAAEAKRQHETGRVLLTTSPPPAGGPKPDPRKKPGKGKPVKKKTKFDSPFVKPEKYAKTLRNCRHCKETPVAVNGGVPGEHLDADCSSLSPGTQGSAKVARATTPSQVSDSSASFGDLFDGHTEFTLPLECISENPDNFASAMAESGRTLMLRPSGTISRPPPEPDSVVDSDSRKIFVYIPTTDTPFGGIFFGNYQHEVFPLLQSHWVNASRAEISTKLRRCETLDAAVAECTRNHISARFHGPVAISTDDGLVSPGELLLDDQDDEPASLDPGGDDLVWSRDHRGAAADLEREIQAEKQAENDAQTKLELKRTADDGTAAALTAQTEALERLVGLIGAREAALAPKSRPVQPSSVVAPNVVPPSPLGHSGRSPQCQTPGCTKDRWEGHDFCTKMCSALFRSGGTVNGSCNADGCNYSALAPHPFCSRTCANTWGAADAIRVLECDPTVEAMQRASEHTAFHSAGTCNSDGCRYPAVDPHEFCSRTCANADARKHKQARAAASRTESNRQRALELKAEQAELESKTLRLMRDRAEFESEKLAADEARISRRVMAEEARQRYRDVPPQHLDRELGLGPDDGPPSASVYPPIAGTPAVGLPILFSRKEAVDAVSSLTPSSPLVEIKRISRSAELSVRLDTGGRPSDSKPGSGRNRTDILVEMRSEMGLPIPLEWKPPEAMPEPESAEYLLRRQRELSKLETESHLREQSKSSYLRCTLGLLAGVFIPSLIAGMVAFSFRHVDVGSVKFLPDTGAPHIDSNLVSATIPAFGMILLTSLLVLARQANDFPWPGWPRSALKSSYPTPSSSMFGGTPLWIVIAMAISQFFYCIPSLWLSLCYVRLKHGLLTEIPQGYRDTHHLILGEWPVRLYRRSLRGTSLILVASWLLVAAPSWSFLSSTLALNWPLVLCQRLARGGTRAQHLTRRLAITCVWLATRASFLDSNCALPICRRLDRGAARARHTLYLLVGATFEHVFPGSVWDAPLYLAPHPVATTVVATTVVTPTRNDYLDTSSSPRKLRLWKPTAALSPPQRMSLATGERQRGRCLLAGPGKRSPPKQSTVSAPPPAFLGKNAWLTGFMDSGCSWHVHYIRDDLINLRESHDSVTGIDENEHNVEAIGDLPAIARNHNGKLVKVLIRNVRYVPTMNDTLFSIDQFWEDSKVDVVFRNERCIVLPRVGDQPEVKLPFRRESKLYCWNILPLRNTSVANVAPSEARVLKASTIHAPSAVTHIASLPAEQAVDVLHRRLHASIDTIRRLADMASDVPNSVRRGVGLSCEHCRTANATRLAHPGSAYKPSYPGRLIHGDIAGPFKTSTSGKQYFLVLIDDHTRYKEAYFLRSKSEAIHKVRAFISKFNAIVNVGKSHPTKIVGSFHSDNAGEFLSKDFEEMLDLGSVSHSRCPAHVHQLNGVAERAIRTIMENVRANIEASAAPISFWPHLVEHAIDCLNRTTGPPGSALSSFEALTGAKPKIMSIMPFGCTAYAVKPREAFSKTYIDSRAWPGVNLGRVGHTPKAYNIWVPSLKKIVCTSEVYFDEAQFPWRAKGDQRIGTVLPHRSQHEGDNEIGGEHAQEADATHTSKSQSLPEEFDRATRGDDANARRSRKVLILFSGAYRRPDGLAAFLTKMGLVPVLLDNDPKSGGGTDGDILNDDVHSNLLRRIASGEFLAIIASPPCSTFSISRHFAGVGDNPNDNGPPVVRIRTEIRGLGDVPKGHKRELLQANAIVARMAALLNAGIAVGTQFLVENPADRGDPAHPRRYLDPEHGPLWLMPEMLALIKQGAREATFPMCAFGAPWQKYTTFVYSAGFDGWLDALNDLKCDHTSHERAAGGTVGSKAIPSSETSAYPADLNLYIAKAAFHLLYGDGTATAPAGHPAGEDDLPTTARPGSGYVQTPSIPTSRTIEHAPPNITAPIPSAPEEPRLFGSPDDVPDDADTAPSPVRAPTPRKRLSTPVNNPNPTRSSRRQPGNISKGLNNSHGWVALVKATTLGMRLHSSDPDTHWSDSVHADELRQHTKEENEQYLLDMKTAHDNAIAGNITDEVLGSHYISRGPYYRQYLLELGQTSVDGPPAPQVGFAALAKASSADPKTQSEAYASDEAGWRASEKKEVANHESNGSWVLVERSSVPRNRNLIKLIWVYKVKRDGSLKSRLCVQGCRQVPGVDYDQTWSGTMRGASLRLLSAVAAASNMRMRRWDFVAAYLQGELVEGEVVYCLPPSGYAKVGRDGQLMVCKVVKPVYGMAQAGRRWQRSLFPWLLEYGFVQCNSDPSVFTLERSMTTPDGPRVERLHLGVYVDDLSVLYATDDDHSLYRDFATKLQERWKVEDEGDCHDLLGVEFEQTKDHLLLHQKTYIEKLSADFFSEGVPTNVQSNRPPCDHTLAQHVCDAALQEIGSVDAKLLKRYQSLVGALLYCAGNTRPDVSYSVGMLCRVMSRPTPEMYDEALRVLGYLYRTRELGLRYVKSDKPLAGQSDSDWAVRHSTSGWQFTYSQAVVSWGSKKQASVALSSCEAEIMAASEAAKEAVYLSRFLAELGLGVDAPVEMGMDNQAAIAISYNPELHSRTKHIDRRHFFVRECVENMQIRVPYVNTVDNLADFFTKALSTKNFYRMRDLIMNVSPAQNGGVPSVPVEVPSSTGGQYSPIGSPTGGC